MSLDCGGHRDRGTVQPPCTVHNCVTPLNSKHARTTLLCPLSPTIRLRRRKYEKPLVLHLEGKTARNDFLVTYNLDRGAAILRYHSRNLVSIYLNSIYKSSRRAIFKRELLGLLASGNSYFFFTGPQRRLSILSTYLYQLTIIRLESAAPSTKYSNTIVQ